MSEWPSVTNSICAALDEQIAERERVVRSVRPRGRDLARACHAMARSFSRGGTLIPFGTGPAATDAAHAAVEFMHPVIVGKRALPAIAPSNDPAGTIDLSESPGPATSRSGSPRAPASGGVEFLAEARRRGLLTIAMSGGGTASDAAEHASRSPSEDPTDHPRGAGDRLPRAVGAGPRVLRASGAARRSMHHLRGRRGRRRAWSRSKSGSAMIEKDGAREDVAVDLVEGVQAGDSCSVTPAWRWSGWRVREVRRARGDPTGLPVPVPGAGGDGLDAVLADVEASTRRKAEDVIALRREIDTGAVARCAEDVRARLDARRAPDHLRQRRVLDRRPGPRDGLRSREAAGARAEERRGDHHCSRQRRRLRQGVRAPADPAGAAHDVAIAISTSGSSANIDRRTRGGPRRGMLTFAHRGV